MRVRRVISTWLMRVGDFFFLLFLGVASPWPFFSFTVARLPRFDLVLLFMQSNVQRPQLLEL